MSDTERWFYVGGSRDGDEVEPHLRDLECIEHLPRRPFRPSFERTVEPPNLSAERYTRVAIEFERGRHVRHLFVLRNPTNQAYDPSGFVAMHRILDEAMSMRATSRRRRESWHPPDLCPVPGSPILYGRVWKCSTCYSWGSVVDGIAQEPSGQDARNLP